MFTVTHANFQEDNHRTDTVVLHRNIILSMNSIKELLPIHHEIPSLLTYWTLTSPPTEMGVSQYHLKNLTTPFMAGRRERRCIQFQTPMLKLEWGLSFNISLTIQFMVIQTDENTYSMLSTTNGATTHNILTIIIILKHKHGVHN